MITQVTRGMSDAELLAVVLEYLDLNPDTGEAYWRRAPAKRIVAGSRAAPQVILGDGA